jgi:ABC-2 type transport system permease protein
MGAMSMRLLRPIHPMIAFASSHLAAIPFRSVVALPIAVILLIGSGASALTTEPVQLAWLVPSLVLAWTITFSMMFMLGCFAFVMTRSMSVLNLYFLLFSLLSGYLLPIPLLPWWIREPAEVLPFRFMLSAPIELMTRALSRHDLASLLAGQLAWTIVMLALALWVFRRGVRRFEAVGG